MITGMQLFVLISFNRETAFSAKAQDTGIGNIIRYLVDAEDNMKQCALDPGLGKFFCFKYRCRLQKSLQEVLLIYQFSVQDFLRHPEKRQVQKHFSAADNKKG